MLPAPLYRGAVEPLRGLDPLCGNGGLWFDKFCNTWEVSKEKQQAQNRSKWYDCQVEKKCWLDNFVGMVGDEQQLTAFAERRCRFLNALGMKPIELVTESRFVTGLGREHPIENGFAWHHVLGVPYLPGSSVKGLVRAWAESWLEDKPSPDIHRILGRLENNDGNVGSVIFFEAIPMHPVRLEKDVMTPHYGPYYQEGEIPGDWHSPTPIPFLVVAEGQTFTFAVAPSSRGRSDQFKKDSDTAHEWLQNALEWLGAGAKTAVGYGRFTQPTDSNRTQSASSAEQRKRNPNLNPEAGKPPPKSAPLSSTGRSQGGSVKAKFLGPHEKLKNAFWVQEEGKKKGLLKYGTPPATLPAVSSEIDVYRTNDNPQSPEYRWDKPASTSQGKPKGAPGGQRPRGRR